MSSLRTDTCGVVSAVQRPVTTIQRQHCFSTKPSVARAHKFYVTRRPMSIKPGRMEIVKVAMVGDVELSADDVMYETLIVLRPDMTDEQRDIELAKFQAFLEKESAHNVQVTVRGRQRLAYPIKNFAEGIYVLYTYAAAPHVSQAVQKTLSTPEAGSELNILRHMTFKI